MHSYMIVSSKHGVTRMNISIYTKTLEKYGGIKPLSTLNIKHATCNLCFSEKWISMVMLNDDVIMNATPQCQKLE